MKTCNQCNTHLTDNARFCHNCGAKVLLTNLSCPECTATNTSGSHFCFKCGYNFSKEALKHQQYEPKYQLSFVNTAGLSEQIKVYFFKKFRERINVEHDANQYSDYLERFYASEFGKRFELRMQQLSEETYLIHSRQEDHTHRIIDQLLDKNFNSLLDHFIILYCKDLNTIPLPERILSYENVRQGDFDLQTMILHFLDFENEGETYYTDFVVMPIKKLRNASSAFLFPDPNEKILLICDQTIFGSCKEGFAFTEKGLYWKAHFEKAHRVLFHHLDQIEKEKDWLTINEHFFNVNPSLNLKVLKLLKKLKEIY